MTPVFTLTPDGILTSLRAVTGWVKGVFVGAREQVRVVDGLKQVVGSVSETVLGSVSHVVMDTKGAVMETARPEL